MENCGVVEKVGEMAGKSAAEVPVSEQRTGDEAECKYAHTPTLLIKVLTLFTVFLELR